MTENYHKQITDLTDWFSARLPNLGKVNLSRNEYKDGICRLTGNHDELQKQAFTEWLENRHYELSYNQMCIAFFSAAGQLGLLEITD